MIVKLNSITFYSVLHRRFGFGPQNLHVNFSISASSFFLKLLPTSCATQQHTISENPIQKIWIRHLKSTYIPFYYLKSVHLCVCLNCCRGSVKPGSITCQSILHRIRIQHRPFCREPFIATIYWRQEISYYKLKNPAYFHFYFIAAIVTLISAAIGFRVFHI